MKIVCVQLDSKLRDVQGNIATADALVAGLTSDDVDLLVLPELAFTGYNFTSAEDIEPYLEEMGDGASSTWAKRVAQDLQCVVSIGYPETCTAGSWEDENDIKTVWYNSLVTYAPNNLMLGHYRKSFLYYTDESWASEGSGFGSVTLPLSLAERNSASIPKPDPYKGIKVTQGICMDLNPYKFTAAWDAYELANFIVRTHAELVMVSMAWSSHALTPEDVQGENSSEPDMHNVAYWLARLQPVVDQQERDVVLVFANRCGVEPGGGTTVQPTEHTCYVGSSTVLKVGKGKVLAWDFLGKGVEGLLKADTSTEPPYALVSRD